MALIPASWLKSPILIARKMGKRYSRLNKGSAAIPATWTMARSDAKGEFTLQDTVAETSPRMLSLTAYKAGWAFAGMSWSDAEFDGPEGIVLDSAGDLFIADTENQRVREIPHLFGSA